jgi:hypothetical protein
MDDRVREEGKRERGKEGKRERGKEGKRERGKEGKRERGKEVSSLRIHRVRCRKCTTGAQIIRRTLDVENACPSAECLLDEFMHVGRDLLKRFHQQDYRMLERLVYDPADAVVIAAGNLLDVNGELQRAEIRRFLETGEQHLSRVRDSELHGKWRSFVSVRLKRTVVEMREDDNPWARKIRWSVEKVVCKEASVQRITDSRTVLYYRAIDGDPDLDATRMGTDEILAELLSYPSRAN